MLTIKMLVYLAQQLFFYNGSQYVFHGVNVIPAFPPYYPDTTAYSEDYSFTIEDIYFMKQHSLNLITLQLIVPAVFPTPNITAYNKEYFFKIREVISLCEQNDIAVIISLYNHYVSELNCGQGFPQWLVNNSAPASSHYFPVPIMGYLQRHDNGTVIYEFCTCMDPSYSYFDMDIFKYVYSDKQFTGLLEMFWEVTLKELHGKYTNVVAYQLFTEPQVSVYPDSLNLKVLPNFHSKLLQPFLNFEPPVQTPVIVNPACNDFFEKYTPPPTKLPLAFGYTDDAMDLTSEFADNLLYFAYRAARTNCTALISSFGRNLEATQISNITSAALDMSWSYFSLKGYGDRIARCLTCSSDYSRGVILKQLSAPYFSKIAGNLISQQFNYSDSKLQLSFQTGEIGDYSVLEISADWKLFGTSIYYYFGQEAIEVVIDDGKIKVRNALSKTLVGLQIQ